MTTTIGFRPTADDERIIQTAMRAGERTSDVIRRALRLLEREVWVSQARADAERLADEDLSKESASWWSGARSTESISGTRSVTMNNEDESLVWSSAPAQCHGPS